MYPLLRREKVLTNRLFRAAVDAIKKYGQHVRVIGTFEQYGSVGR